MIHARAEGAVLICLALVGLCCWLSRRALALLMGADMRAVRSFGGLLWAIGTAYHEIAHVVACLITFTRVRKVCLRDAVGGGHVIHDRPRWPLVVQPFISASPAVAGVVALMLLGQLFAHASWPLKAAIVLLAGAIGATLAPSDADVRLAAKGLLMLGAAGVVTWFVYPGWVAALGRWPSVLSGRFIQIDGALFLLWLGLVSLRTLLHRNTR
jgi:hypothetical protein